jgi:hypothetical protein
VRDVLGGLCFCSVHDRRAGVFELGSLLLASVAALDSVLRT